MFHFFEMLKEGLKVRILFLFYFLFYFFSSRKQGNKYVQNILLAFMIVAKMVDLDIICIYMVGMDKIPCNKMNF